MPAASWTVRVNVNVPVRLFGATQVKLFWASGPVIVPEVGLTTRVTGLPAHCPVEAFVSVNVSPGKPLRSAVPHDAAEFPPLTVSFGTGVLDMQKPLMPTTMASTPRESDA